MIWLDVICLWIGRVFIVLSGIIGMLGLIGYFLDHTIKAHRSLNFAAEVFQLLDYARRESAKKGTP